MIHSNFAIAEANVYYSKRRLWALLKTISFSIFRGADTLVFLPGKTYYIAATNFMGSAIPSNSFKTKEKEILTHKLMKYIHANKNHKRSANTVNVYLWIRLQTAAESFLHKTWDVGYIYLANICRHFLKMFAMHDPKCNNFGRQI